MLFTSAPGLTRLDGPFAYRRWSLRKLQVPPPYRSMCHVPHAMLDGRAIAPRPPASDVITSTDNSYVKHCVKLRGSKAYRQQAGSVLLVGETVVREVVAGGSREGPVDIRVLFVVEGRPTPQGCYAAAVVRCSERVMQKLTGLQSVEGLVAAAEVALPAPADLSSWQAGTLQRLLVVEGVQDPGNLGTLMRSALALGWQAVYLLPGCVDPFNDKVIRASRGAVFRLPIATGDWSQLSALTEQHGMLCVAADPRATGAAGNCKLLRHRPGSPRPADANNGPYPDPLVGALHAALQAAAIALVLGTEGQGLSEESKSRCTPLGIPISDEMESLNVGVAGAILMFALSSRSLPLLLSQLL